MIKEIKKVSVVTNFQTWGNNAEDSKDGDVFVPNKYVERVRR